MPMKSRGAQSAGDPPAPTVTPRRGPSTLPRMIRTSAITAAMLSVLASCSGEPDKLRLTYFNVDG